MGNQRYVNALKQAGQKLIDSAESICGDINQSQIDDLSIWLSFEEDGHLKLNLDKTYIFNGGNNDRRKT
jgi:hypothetical protein